MCKVSYCKWKFWKKKNLLPTPIKRLKSWSKWIASDEWSFLPMYIDLFTSFCDSTGRLNKVRHTNDGLHLTGAGHIKWKEEIGHVVCDYPALIPKLPIDPMEPAKKIFILKSISSDHLQKNCFQNGSPIFGKSIEECRYKCPNRTKPQVKWTKMQRNNNGHSSLSIHRWPYSIKFHSGKYIIINAEQFHMEEVIQTKNNWRFDGKSIIEILDWPSFPWGHLW